MPPTDPTDPTDPIFLNTREAAALLGRQPSTLAGWRSARRGPPFSLVCGRPAYQLDALRRWAETRETIDPEGVLSGDGEGAA